MFKFSDSISFIIACAIITAKNGAKNFLSTMFDLILRPEEKAALKLRALYENHSYSFYRMSRFEEYDFYADKKDFLISRGILTFTDINGKLMALRPDVTLSIIKHIKNFDGVQKFYYDEKVYRVPKNADTFHEMAQAGIECINNDGKNYIAEVLELAIQSLHTIAEGRRCVLDVSHAGLIAEMLSENEKRSEILKCIAGKNIHELKNSGAPEKIIRLAEIEGRPDTALPELEKITGTKPLEVLNTLKKYNDKIRVDFSVVNNLNYYNGIVFRGFIEGIPESILSGGQYDNLMRLMGHKNTTASGFAVYLDLI